MERLFADKIIQNGVVLTVNSKDEIAEAVAIRGDRILAVGSSADIAAYRDDHTQVIDAGGKTVLPGFIDAHIHLGMYGLLDHGVINVAYQMCIRDRPETVPAAVSGNTWAARPEQTTPSRYGRS